MGERRRRRTCRAAAVAVGVVLLGFGLWPFELWPANRVGWLADHAGIGFDGLGVAFTDAGIEWRRSASGDELTVHLWVRPAEEPSGRVGHIASWFDGARVEPFMIGQWRDGLVVRVRLPEPARGRGYLEYGVPGALPAGEAHCISISSGPRGTTVCVDGERRETRARARVLQPGDRLRGRLVLGNSATGRQRWEGEILGVAILERALAVGEIAAQVDEAARGGVTSLVRTPDLVAMYAFGEGEGALASSLVGAAAPLHMPPRFAPLRREFFLGVEPGRWSKRGFILDVVLNVLGFVPLGYLVAAACALRRRGSRLGAVLLAVACGALLSFGIELTQVWMPSRRSSVVDLGTNSLGALFGALLAVAGPGTASREAEGAAPPSDPKSS